MFDKFGCFIINEEKGSLKFYNGPGFSNQYAKPQFSKNTSGLLGIDWKQQTIQFKVGLYWFTIEEYQNFLECINPYEINYLTFNYAPDYGYLVKLGKISDSTRYVVGRNNEGEVVYYTELDLTWELIGDSCVRSNNAYEYNCEHSENSQEYIWTINKEGMQDETLLDTGVVFELPVTFTNSTSNLKLEAIYDVNTEVQAEVVLFNISMQNLVFDKNSSFDKVDIYNTSQTQDLRMTIRYDSESGLMYVQEGDNTIWHLLNFQTDNANGDYILKSGDIQKWKIPGVFSSPNTSIKNWQFKLTAQNIAESKETMPENVLTIYARKNIV